MKEEEAATLALRVLAFLTRDSEALGRFLDASGLGLADLTGRAGDGDLLGAVLDYLLGDEKLLLSACESLPVTPRDVIKARAALPGGIAEWA